VRQGCPLSPLLFNIYIEELIREALENTKEGVKVGGKIIKALRFADDRAMLAGSESDLQRMMDRFNMVSVKINADSHPCLHGSESAMKIVVAGEIIEQVKEFCYLGSKISNDARCHS